MRGFARAAAAAVLVAACSPPKYVGYTSVKRDFKASVPWGWNVMTDEAPHYFNTTFIGPYEPDFFLGAPSLSVRWYGNGRGHTAPDGTIELYADGGDFIRQQLTLVYKEQRQMLQPVHEVLVAGRKAKHFVVVSPVDVPAHMQHGVSVQRGGKRVVNLRQHAYAVLQLDRGFYVLIYPATRDGFPLYENAFNQLVNTFTPLSEGPGGPPVPAAAAGK